MAQRRAVTCAPEAKCGGARLTDIGDLAGCVRADGVRPGLGGPQAQGALVHQRDGQVAAGDESRLHLARCQRPLVHRDARHRSVLRHRTQVRSRSNTRKSGHAAVNPEVRPHIRNRSSTLR